ncbi:6-phosphogluconolactonase [Saccharospirillum impatiens]|uniref:6-phosphogluconolactonase n=1 Tax=Saccharospirillum impatiens TaxID=169438 RepID=UPI000409E927|nr:6-phosphogluconolactonase [Saccharospirillum impatiens]
MTLTQHDFDSRETLTEALAGEILKRLKADIDANGEAGLAVSGGRTPVALFQTLSQADLDWSKVTVTLVDERWVAPDHDDSNEKLVRTHLLQNKAAVARFIPHKTAADSPFEAESELNKALAGLPDKLTVSILGMGEDGHTASFFPGADTLEKALDTDVHSDCCAVVPKTAPHPRMTLTLQRILRSDWIVLHLTGAGKKPVLEAALKDGPVNELPVRSVLKQQQAPVAVYWAE